MNSDCDPEDDNDVEKRKNFDNYIDNFLCYIRRIKYHYYRLFKFNKSHEEDLVYPYLYNLYDVLSSKQNFENSSKQHRLEPIDDSELIDELDPEIINIEKEDWENEENEENGENEENEENRKSGKQFYFIKNDYSSYLEPKDGDSLNEEYYFNLYLSELI